MILNNSYEKDTAEMTNIFLIFLLEAGLYNEEDTEPDYEKDSLSIIARIIGKIFEDLYLNIDRKTMMEKQDYFSEFSAF